MRISLPSPRTAGPGSTIIQISQMQPRWYRHRPIQPASVTEPVHLTGFGTSDRLYNKLDFHALKTHGHQSLSYTAKTNTVLWRRARICLLINFSFSLANCRHRTLLFCDLFIYILPPSITVSGNIDAFWNLCWCGKSALFSTSLQFLLSRKPTGMFKTAIGVSHIIALSDF